MTVTADTLVVSEVFGPTLQGEGPATGRRAAFVRLGGCNLSCSWCDTPYTWDGARYDLRAELGRRPVADLAAQVAGMDPDVVVVTGGEPLLQQRQPAWDTLLRLLAPWPVHVETNGTQVPTDASLAGVTLFAVSPKLAHAGDSPAARLVPAALHQFAAVAQHDRAVLKVVCRTPADVADTAALAATYNWPARQVYVMPEGTTTAEVLDGARELVDAVLVHGLSMTTRLHTLLWGQERAR